MTIANETQTGSPEPSPRFGDSPTSPTGRGERETAFENREARG
jgi:hypothetical protein